MTQKFTKNSSYLIHPFPCHIIYSHVQTITHRLLTGVAAPELKTAPRPSGRQSINRPIFCNLSLSNLDLKLLTLFADTVT